MQALKLKFKKAWSVLRRLKPKKRYQTVMAVFFSFFVISGLVIFATPVGALELTFTSVAQGLIFGMSSIFLAFARVAIGLTTFGLRMFLELAAYNDYINAPPVVVGWFMVRDVANMFFVVALLVIAFGTILGIEQYEWRKALAKLVLAAILINFSRLICGLIIDAAHVFTITFLNAVRGAAGGNLINMFKMDKILSLSQTNPNVAENKEDLRLDLFVASITALMFAILAMVTIGAYLVVMIARVVVLWVAIIMSPLAFVLQTLPQTKSYADEWWQEFTKHVLAAPLMVFFLWLAFATLGSGDINNHVGIKSLRQNAETQTLEIVQISSNPTVSLTEVSSWENMSAFFIAMAFLIVGLERVQKLGVKGGGAVGSALSFGKRVATIATGYAAGRYLVGKGANLGKRVALAPINAAGKHGKSLAGKAASYVGYRLPYIGKRALQNQWQGVKAWAADDGRSYKVKNKLNDKDEEYIDPKTGKIAQELDLHPVTGLPQIEEDAEKTKRSWVQKAAHFAVSKDLAAEKKLKKTTDFADNRMALLSKRVTGVPSYALMREDEVGVDALDRVEQGVLAAEQARSKAKTDEYSGIGELATLIEPRFKDGKLQVDGGSMQLQLSQHKNNAAAVSAQKDAVTGDFDLQVALSTKGIAAIRRKEAAEVKAKTATDQLERISETEERDFLRTAEGQGLLAARTEALEEIEAADAEISTLKGEARETFKNSPDGIVARDNLLRAQEKLETIDSRISQISGEDKKVFLRDDPEGQALLASRTKAQEQITAAEAVVKTLEGEARFEALTKTPEGVAARDELIKAEEQLATIDQKLSQVSEDDKAKFQSSRDGRKLLKERKIAEERKKVATRQIETLNSVVKKQFYKSAEGKDVMSSLNEAEQRGQAAEAFVGGVKNKQIAEQFLKAKDFLKTVDGTESIEAVLRRAPVGSDAYVDVLAQSEIAAAEQNNLQTVQQDATDLASDAFVNIPRHGITTPSSALASASEREEAGMGRMERSKAAMSALLNLAHSVAYDADGNSGKLPMDRRIKLDAHSARLSAENWTDDEQDSLVDEMARIKEGSSKLNALQQKNVLILAKKLHDSGYAPLQNVTNIDPAALKFDGKASKTVTRRSTAYLQNVHAVGGDLDLVGFHSQLQLEVSRLLNSDVPPSQIPSYEALAKDYISKNGGFGSIRSLDEFKNRYEENQPFLEKATIDNKKNALSNGHPESGGNQDNDAAFGMHRMMFDHEAELTMDRDHAKIPPTILVKAQVHGNGDWNTEHGILDNHNEKVMAPSVGAVKKSIDMRDAPKRTMHGYVWTHQDKKATSVIKEVEVNGKTEKVQFAKIGGEEAYKYLAEEKGVTDPVEQRVYMLKHGQLAQMMAGDDTLGHINLKVFKNIDEFDDIPRGIVNITMGEGEAEKNYRGQDEMAQQVLDDIKAAGGKGAYFKGTRYEAPKEQERVIKRMNDMIAKYSVLKNQPPPRVKNRQTVAGDEEVPS